jgi:hypothetical protein
MTNVSVTDWKLRSDQPNAQSDRKADEPTLRIPLPELEVDESVVGYAQNTPADYPLPDRPPIAGARTSRFRVLRSYVGERSLTLECEGIAGSQSALSLLRNSQIVPRVQAKAPTGKADAVISAKDGSAFKDPKAPLLLVMNFPEGEGWKTITVTLTW